MRQAKFEVKLSNAGKQYFVLRAKTGNHMTSEEYESRASVVKGINSVKRNSIDEAMYQRFVGEDGQYYFNLRAKNNKVIGVSEGYRWKFSRWIGIESIRKNAPDAIINWMT